MRNCIYCEGELSDTATFCPDCGEKQEVKINFRYCENCAEQHSLNAKFCPACATPVGFNLSQNQHQYQEIETQPKQVNRQQKRSVSEELPRLRVQHSHFQQQDDYQQQRSSPSKSRRHGSQQNSIIKELFLREKTFAVLLAVATCLQVIILFFAIVALISISRRLNLPDGYYFMFEDTENMLRSERTEFLITVLVSLITVGMNSYIVYLSLKFKERILQEPVKVFNQLTNPVYYIVAFVINLVFLVMAMGVWIFGFLIGAGGMATFVYRFLKTRAFALENASELGVAQ